LKAIYVLAQCFELVHLDWIVNRPKGSGFGKANPSGWFVTPFKLYPLATLKLDFAIFDFDVEVVVYKDCWLELHFVSVAEVM